MLWVQGWSIPEITEHLARARPYVLSERQVRQDLHAWQEVWQARLAQPREELLSEELAKLQTVERAAWAAYCACVAAERATKGAGPRFALISPAEGAELLRPRVEAWRYLRLILETVTLRTRLLGLAAPEWHVQVTTSADVRELARELLTQYPEAIPEGGRAEDVIDLIVQDAEMLLAHEKERRRG
jgi:hypothetical protein